MQTFKELMGETLTKLVNKHQKKWSEHLPNVQLAYNVSKTWLTDTNDD